MEENTNPGNQQKSSGAKAIIALVAVILIAVAAFWYVGRNQTAPMEEMASHTNQQSQPMSSQPEASKTTQTTQSSDNQTAITVQGGNFFFKPNEIHVKKGQKVTITFSNSGGIHDFVIDEFNVRTQPISGGQTATVSFTPDKTGSFEYYCSVANHRQMGMKGTLIVE